MMSKQIKLTSRKKQKQKKSVDARICFVSLTLNNQWQENAYHKPKQFLAKKQK